MYLLCIPSGYLLLVIYSLCNLHVVSWGTREVAKKKTKLEQAEEAKAAEERAKAAQKKKGFFSRSGVDSTFSPKDKIFCCLKSCFFKLRFFSQFFCEKDRALSFSFLGIFFHFWHELVRSRCCCCLLTRATELWSSNEIPRNVFVCWSPLRIQG